MMKTNFRPNPNWLTCVVPRRQPFFPQIGDEVVYFRLGIICDVNDIITQYAMFFFWSAGHEWFVEQTTDLFELNKVNYTTTYSRNMGEQEIGKIAEIEFEMYKKERLCCLKVKMIAWYYYMGVYVIFKFFLSLNSRMPMGCLLVNRSLSNIMTLTTFWISWYFDRVMTWLFGG